MRRRKNKEMADLFEMDELVCGKGKPFVKWVGGKSRVAYKIDGFMPRDLIESDNLVYVDPFVGAGGMMFYMLQTYPNIKKVIVNDINNELISCLECVRDNPELVIEVLKDLDIMYHVCPNIDIKKAMYERKRSLYNKRVGSKIESAAMFIFLNRTCYNGMHRVNKKGEFNVPFGQYDDPIICDAELIRKDSELLQNVELMCGDYKEAIKAGMKYIEDGYDVMFYMDPPYRPVSKTACFSKFAKTPFGDDKQEELADLCKEIDYAGGRFLLSNSDGYSYNKEDTFLIDLYHKFNIGRVYNSRTLNAKSDGRGQVPELVIYNYNLTKNAE